MMMNLKGIIEMNPQTPDNEVARLREEANTWHQHYRDEASKAQKCKQAYIELEKEVARLREKNERQAERIRYLEGATNHACGTPLSRDNREIDRLKAELARLAPTPEEPKGCIHASIISVTNRGEKYDQCSKCGKKFKQPVPDKNKNTEQPVSNSDWRELGHDEVIQEGDEVFSLGMWIPVSPNLAIQLNDKRKPEVRSRTRRPLPKQEEMPLDADIASIEWSCAHTARAIRYLRDEIQKLKTQPHFHHESYCRKCQEAR